MRAQGVALTLAHAAPQHHHSYEKKNKTDSHSHPTVKPQSALTWSAFGGNPEATMSVYTAAASKERTGLAEAAFSAELGDDHGGPPVWSTGFTVGTG